MVNAVAGGKITFAGEVGGTFTDIILLEETETGCRMTKVKVPTTPANPEKGLLNGFDRCKVSGGDVDKVLHGSTIGTNAVLERRGVPTAVITTSGFRDILEIQRGDKSNIYDLAYQRIPPLVPRSRVFPLRERTDADGNILTEIDEKQLPALVAELKAKEIEAVAVCFLHSYRNSHNEIRAKQIVEKQCPEMLVLASSEVVPQFREYERFSTTVMSAYIAPRMASYVRELREELRKRGFSGSIFITQSNGGVLPASAIKREVVRTLLSGPAAGVTGATYMAKQLSIEDIITLDMGGTSTDVCLINQGQPTVNTENKLNNLPIAVPMIDICSVGAGGGSIAWLDEGGMLRVGPQSAGASPGPACYGRGGVKPTLTDAHVFCRTIDPDNFVGGEFPLDREASIRAIVELAEECGMSSEDLAEAIIKISINNMVQAVRVVSTERGHDPRHYTLVPFGGAGPLHAVTLAEELGIERLVVPRHAGIMSAFGLLVADIVRDYVRTNIRVTSTISTKEIRGNFKAIVQQATDEFTAYGYKAAILDFDTSLDLRYAGQAFEIAVPVSSGMTLKSIERCFHEAHLKRYGHASNEEEIEIVNYRVKARVKAEEKNLDFTEEESAAAAQQRDVFLDGHWTSCSFIDRRSLGIGDSLSGPVLIQEETSAFLLNAGWKVTVEKNQALLVVRER